MDRTADTQQLFRLLSALIDATSQPEAARQLAQHLAAEDLLIFLRDAEAGVLLPAPGFVQTLPGGRRWQEFLAACHQEEPAHATLPFPDASTMMPAVGLTGGNGTVLVLLGGAPRLDEVALLVTLLPLLEAAFRREHERQLAEAQAEIARKAAAETQALIPMLDVARQVAQKELHERTQVEVTLREQVRMAALQMDVGRSLTAGGMLRECLGQCANALVQHLDAAFARIWTLNEAEQMLELQASAGMYTHLDGGHARVPVGSLKIGRIAKKRKPHLTNAVIGDRQVTDQAWAKREGMVAFAGYPLLIENRLVGVMALFARHKLSEIVLSAMASVANAVALGIERHRTEEVLRHSAERLRFMAESMPQKIFTAKPNGDVDYFNPQWMEFTGLSFEAIRDWGWLQFIHPEDVAENVSRWQHAVDTGEPFYFEHRFRRADGVYRWHVSRAIPLRDAQGRITMWIGSNTDITEQKELERQKEVFVSMATHELKTPLTALQANIQLAHRRLSRLDGMLAEDQVEPHKILEGVLATLTRGQEQVRVQNRLITDLLDTSRLQENTLELQLAPCDLASLVSVTVQDYQAASPQRRIMLELPDQEVLRVAVDRDRIVQVLSNYLTNALKYSPADAAVQVGIACEPTMVRVWVADHGPGLSPEAQEHIWEQFYRVPDIDVQSGSGVSLGLGLSICQGLINRHHGQVGVESTPGQGARFWFTLPLLPAEA